MAGRINRMRWGPVVLLSVWAVSLPSASLWSEERPDALRGLHRTRAVYTRSPWERHCQRAETEFNRGLLHYDQGRYEKALVYFRRAAVADPETPHLASYLIRTEHQILRQKTALEDIPMETVSEKPIASAASAAPTPPQAAPALSNPAEAQKHYEAGLIAYAKNELNEAKRHWVITCRLNKEHPKAAQALKRVQDEIAIENHKPR